MTHGHKHQWKRYLMTMNMDQRTLRREQLNTGDPIMNAWKYPDFTREIVLVKRAALSHYILQILTPLHPYVLK